MIRLNCFMEVPAAERDRVLSLATELTLASRQQSGCIDYDIFESATRPGVMMFCETWKDQEALDAHSASEVFRRCVDAIQAVAPLHVNSFEF